MQRLHCIARWDRIHREILSTKRGTRVTHLQASISHYIICKPLTRRLCLPDRLLRALLPRAGRHGCQLRPLGVAKAKRPQLPRRRRSRRRGAGFLQQNFVHANGLFVEGTAGHGRCCGRSLCKQRCVGGGVVAQAFNLRKIQIYYAL